MIHQTRTGKILLIFLALFFSGATVIAEEISEPDRLIRESVDRVRSTVGSLKGKIPEAELDKKLEEIIFPVFNFAEMSKRSLGMGWQDATEAERDEFVKLFSSMLLGKYLQRIKNINKSEITYKGSTVRDEKSATVRTIVTDEGDDFPIYYQLKIIDGTWQVCDVIIENVSLVSTYRDQFVPVVRKDKMTGLIEELKKKKADIAERESKA